MADADRISEIYFGWLPNGWCGFGFGRINRVGRPLTPFDKLARNNNATLDSLKLYSVGADDASFDGADEYEGLQNHVNKYKTLSSTMIFHEKQVDESNESQVCKKLAQTLIHLTDNASFDRADEYEGLQNHVNEFKTLSSTMICHEKQ
nr:hypothetical protein Iba_chr12aCG20870 [Ipomoea batatas]GMD78442.1 hypothetical protein Iba_chr13cCG13050 [Ipomoea batatas]